jgi:hypothetical protein
LSPTAHTSPRVQHVTPKNDKAKDGAAREKPNLLSGEVYTPRLDGNHRVTVGAHKHRHEVEQVEDEELVAERHKRYAGPPRQAPDK